MRLAWQSVLLLPVLLLPIVVTEAQTCSNGIAGFEASGACCPRGCGQCGGVGCSQQPGGASACCTKDVLAANQSCSSKGSAPCVIDDASSTETCPGGIPGINANNVVCCPLSCGTCSGAGCAGRPGGANDCCGSQIKQTAPLCSDSKKAPCNLVAPVSTETCPGGIPGINANNVVCCPLSCGTCSGAGCAGRPGGANACCGSQIKQTAPLCSDSKKAPCNLVAGPTPTPPSPTPSIGDVPSYLITPATPIMTIPTDPSLCRGGVPKFRFAASTGKVGKGRLYAESAGCFTMTDIYNWRGTVSSGGRLSSKGPIYQLDDAGNIVDPVGPIGSPVTGKWLLAAELYITDGAIFYCKGKRLGGDCDALRIQSNGPTDFYEVRGHGGSLYFDRTIVTSWDTKTKKPQEVYNGGRSYLNCVSEKLTGETCEGRAKNDMGECRMDMINSEISHLGYFASESYGITWKVRGFCRDLSNHDVFTTTNVYGDIRGCDIHHNYYGHYSYGHQGGIWINNKMHDNWQYGFDPHDDSDYLTIANNEVYNNVNHGIIASKRCNNVKIYGNTVHDGGAQAVGIFLHRSSDNAEVYDNRIYNMQDAGIAMLETMNAYIHDNDVTDTRYGIRMSLGSAGNLVENNKFDRASDWGLYTYQGSDPPTRGVSNGRPNQNQFDGNDVTRTPGGIKFKNSDNLIVTNNLFTGTTNLEFYDAQRTKFAGNSLPRSGVCTENIVSDKGNSVRRSTFTGSNGLPSEC